MPWINLTLRRGALSKEKQHAVMSDLTNALMFWEKVPDTPVARHVMKGWVYEVAEDGDTTGAVLTTNCRSTLSRSAFPPDGSTC
jgi:hypothetical protein